MAKSVPTFDLFSKFFEQFCFFEPESFFRAVLFNELVSFTVTYSSNVEILKNCFLGAL